LDDPWRDGLDQARAGRHESIQIQPRPEAQGPNLAEHRPNRHKFTVTART
jgi:hypothetical protein